MELQKIASQMVVSLKRDSWYPDQLSWLLLQIAGWRLQY